MTERRARWLVCRGPKAWIFSRNDGYELSRTVRAVREGRRVFSAYELRDGTRIWIITEADRTVTTILLPEEY
jgi:hypothetical protein